MLLDDYHNLPNNCKQITQKAGEYYKFAADKLFPFISDLIIPHSNPTVVD